jgi:hypothetical protein
LKILITKRAGRVAQGEGPEFKHKYCKKPLKVSGLRNNLMDLVLAPPLTIRETEANMRETFKSRCIAMWLNSN